MTPSIAYLPNPTKGPTDQNKAQSQINVMTVLTLPNVNGFAPSPFTMTLYRSKAMNTKVVI